MTEEGKNTVQSQHLSRHIVLSSRAHPFVQHALIRKVPPRTNSKPIVKVSLDEGRYKNYRKFGGRQSRRFLELVSHDGNLCHQFAAYTVEEEEA